VDPIEGKDREGRDVPCDLFIDITDVFDTKKAMLACHASQRNWLLRQHGMDEYVESMEAWSRKRGRQRGVPYGEGYRQYRGHPYPQDDLLGSLLGEGTGVRGAQE
jgi:LmbE family N-acetylglucosaminyl deacetylase